MFLILIVFLPGLCEKMTQAKFLEYDEKEEYYEEEEEVRAPRRPGEPPDGGWGWMVVFGAFICMMFTEGILFSYQAVIPDLAEYYYLPKDSFTSVGVLMTAFCLIGGKIPLELNKEHKLRFIQNM